MTIRKMTVIACFLTLLAVVGAYTTAILAAKHYDVSVRFLTATGLQRLDISTHFLNDLLKPPPRYVDGELDGNVRLDHPRILLPELSSWEGYGIPPVIQRRLSLYELDGVNIKQFSPCGRSHAMAYVTCWLMTAEPENAYKAIDSLIDGNIPLPSHSASGSGSWQWALAFDLLDRFPGWSESNRAAIASKLQLSLEYHLEQLDDESASLWHGRSTLAANAWLLAVALHGEPGYDTQLTLRAQGHFRQTILALALTEAWPEGYNYWINNRALVIGLAASAWVNGLEQSELSEQVTNAVRRAGLWTIYTTRPDGRVEALGDEGPRVDLKDETRRAIDVVGQLTQDGVFTTFSNYLFNLHGVESYYRGFRWSYLLFNDPSVRPLPGIAKGELAGLKNFLPLSELFGPGALNLWVARTGWGPEDTLITLRAGHTFTHHGHYDAGHFTIFKGAPLVTDSARYNGMFTPHRLYYGIRSISKNTLLVVRPGDTNQPHRLIERAVNDGGQRMPLPTGSAIRDIAHWNAQLGQGKHLEGAELLAYTTDGLKYSYLKVNLTAAYDNTEFDSHGGDGKVESTVREAFYLVDEDVLFIKDKVASTDASFVKRWLLHTINKPSLVTANLLLGNDSGGMATTLDNHIVLKNEPAWLDVAVLKPLDSIIQVIGGDRYRFWVEKDSREQGLLMGESFEEGGNDKPWFDNANWRVELQPLLQQTSDIFFVGLSPSLKPDRPSAVRRVPLQLGRVDVAATQQYITVFTGGLRLADVKFALDGEQHTLVIVGVLDGDTFDLEMGGIAREYQAKESGVLYIPLPRYEPNDTILLRQV